MQLGNTIRKIPWYEKEDRWYSYNRLCEMKYWMDLNDKSLIDQSRVFEKYWQCCGIIRAERTTGDLTVIGYSFGESWTNDQILIELYNFEELISHN